MVKSLFSFFREKYPILIKRAEFSYKDEIHTINIKLEKYRINLWIQETSSEFTVGLDFLHTHYSFTEGNPNKKIAQLKEAFKEFEKFITGKYVGLLEIDTGIIRMTGHIDDVKEAMAESKEKCKLITFE